MACLVPPGAVLAGALLVVAALRLPVGTGTVGGLVAMCALLRSGLLAALLTGLLAGLLTGLLAGLSRMVLARAFLTGSAGLAGARLGSLTASPRGGRVAASIGSMP